MKDQQQKLTQKRASRGCKQWTEVFCNVSGKEGKFISLYLVVSL